MKNKTLATALAAFLGGVGAHRFYLGQRKAWWYLAFSWTLIPVVIGWIDALSFYALTYAAFNRRYNLKHEFRKIFTDDHELHTACTESEREEQLIAALEEMTSREKVREFLVDAKRNGDYLPRAVYAHAQKMLDSQ